MTPKKTFTHAIAKKNLPVIALTLIFMIMLPLASHSEVIKFDDSWGNAGFNLISQDASGVEVVFSIEEMNFGELEIEGYNYTTIGLPGVFLPNEAGAPNLPGDSRYIAVPKEASVRLQIIDSRTVVYQNIDIAPAPEIQWENDDSPPVFEKCGPLD